MTAIELKKKYTAISNYINLACTLYLLIYAALPFGKSHRLAITFFFVTYVIDFILDKGWKNYRNDKTKWIFYGFIIYYLLNPIYYLLFENNCDLFYTILERNLPFLVFGIIGLFGFNDKFRIKYFAYLMGFTSIALLSYLLFHEVGWTNFINNPDRFILFNSIRQESLNNHMVFNEYLNTSLVLIIYVLFSKAENKLSLLGKWILVIVGLIIFISLFLSEGRTGFLTANFIVLASITYFLFSYKKLAGIFFIFLSLLLFFMAYKNHYRMGNEVLKTEPRLIIWEVAKETIEEKPVLGHGACSGRYAFWNNGLKDMDRLEYDWLREDFRTGRAHPHSQYLMTWIEFGVVGLILLLFLFTYPVIAAPPGRRFFVFLFIFIIAFQAVFEIFGPAINPFFFMLILNILFIRQPKEITS